MRIARRRRAAFAAVVLAATAPLLIGSTGNRSNMEERWLASHNRERSAAGLEALEWDNKLAADAAVWAQEVKRIGRLEHYPDDRSDPDPQGENLWAGTRNYYSPEAMVGLWVAEKKHYRPGIFPANSKTGRLDDVAHYTQVMWRSSGKVGCALSSNRADDFLVCRYSEGGNVMGERPF